MKKFLVPVALLYSVFATTFSANAATTEPYNPVEALRKGRSDAEKDAGTSDKNLPGIPEKKRSGGVYFSLAPEYFFDFGSDFHDADGWGASLAATVHFNTITPKWDFLAELETLAFSAESSEFYLKNRPVKETLHSANLLFNFGIARTFFDDFSCEALFGIGMGATYGEIKGERYKTSSSGNFTTTFSAKLRGEYRFSENWSLFAAYRFAYISPSIASKIADLHNLDLLSQSVELGIRLRF